MWLLKCDTYQLEFFEEVSDQDRPSYAVLSHRWGEGEATFKDVLKGRQKDTPGWKKIIKCCDQAQRDGFDYVWIDTCCIDKRSSAELSEAINSMFNWYRLSQVCYAYLSNFTWNGQTAHLESGAIARIAEACHPDDLFWHCQYNDCGAILFTDNEVGIHAEAMHGLTSLFHCKDCNLWFKETSSMSHNQEHEKSKKQAELMGNVWFERGWTLQELLAPREVVFFDQSWQRIGTKHDLCAEIESKTRIPRAALIDDFRNVSSNYCIAEKMSWAAGRRTTRVEDRAYSLLGIFNVNMPLLYGEGRRAFRRLQEELVKTSKDSSIFAWTHRSPWLDMEPNPRFDAFGGMLANDPDSFAGANLTGFWPAVRYFTCSKEGIEGDFALFRHKFEVFAIVLGHFGAFDMIKQIPSKIFVLYLVHIAENEYQRISVDGELFGTFDQLMTRDSWNRTNLTRIRILPTPPTIYSLSDSRETEKVGVKSTLRHSHLGLTDLDMRISPAKLTDYKKVFAPIPRSFSPETTFVASFSTDEHIHIDGYYGLSLQCLVLWEHSVNAKHLLIFGYDLNEKPTVWFAATNEDIEVSESGSRVLRTDRNVQVDLQVAGSGKRLCDSDNFWGNDKDSKKYGTTKDYSDNTTIGILGNEVIFVFIRDDSGHRVLVRTDWPSRICQLPHKWVSE